MNVFVTDFNRHHASHAQLQRVPFSSSSLNLVAQLLPRGFMSPTAAKQPAGTGAPILAPSTDASPRTAHVHKLVNKFEQHGTLHAITTHASLHALRQQQLLLVPGHCSESDAWSTNVSISQGNDFAFAASQSISYHHSLLTPTFGHTHPPVTVQDSTLGRGVAAAAASTATTASLSFCMYVQRIQTSIAARPIACLTFAFNSLFADYVHILCVPKVLPLFRAASFSLLETKFDFTATFPHNDGHSVLFADRA